MDRKAVKNKMAQVSAILAACENIGLTKDRKRSKTVATSNNRGSHQRSTMKSKDIGALTVNNTWSSSGLKVFPKLTQVAPL